MPGKHVHFADSLLDTPSPSWTASSLPSTTGLITPPQVAYPLPPMGVTYKMHPLLAAFGDPQIIYDVSQQASTVTPRDPKTPPFALTLPATEPALPYIEIISPRLPWRLAIYPSMRGSHIVTVGDVISGLYANLRQPVSASEFGLVRSDTQRASITDAFRRRCKRFPTAEAAAREMNKGLKRIDFLEGFTLYSGLSSTKQGGHVWQLNTS